jgi:hypothetical protein
VQSMWGWGQEQGLSRITRALIFVSQLNYWSALDVLLADGWNVISFFHPHPLISIVSFYNSRKVIVYPPLCLLCSSNNNRFDSCSGSCGFTSPLLMPSLLLPFYLPSPRILLFLPFSPKCLDPQRSEFRFWKSYCTGL